MYDAIVVGARCAGSPLAMLLAQQGHRVLVVDRASFPSDTVSSHYMHQAGVVRLRNWGLLDELVAVGTPGATRMSYSHRGVAFSGFADPIDGIDTVYCPRRIVLDEILVNAARRAGAEVLESFTVSDLIWADGAVAGVRGRVGDGPETEFRAPIVIGADGAHSTVAKRVEAPLYNVRPAAGAAYYSYFEGVDSAGLQHHTGTGERWVGSWPTNGGTLVGVMATKAQIKEFRQDVPGNFQSTVDAILPAVGEQLRDATRTDPFIAMRYPDNFYRQAFGPGWALVGDAGYHKDPLTGWGMSDSFIHAEQLAARVHEGLAGLRPMDEALAEFAKTRDEETAVMYDYTTTVAELGELPPFFQAVLEAVAATDTWTTTMLGWIAGGVDDDAIFSAEGLQALYDDAGLPEDRRVYDPTA
ncbi:NAD(P)/FAD-dependent oxidoreductase [Pseudonocardia petroleophila]|uniref:NAD(P)/FAD-dependent oxidoreductase n=1 Tax=Pseudonocardia petroleophila TaxID=37331 RepID=A0A7G7MGF6_9PSEU|nr:NAD(P)/FAD-dependent oxidoreductase [Pseudonocardia petroleophila]QNG51867.1 NAD(P)/FAD-dependent oxidoreductase [Pseudonocardia petroleophila]